MQSDFPVYPIGTSFISATWIDSTGSYFEISDRYTVEKQIDGQWELIKDKNIGDDIIFLVQSGARIDFNINTDPVYRGVDVQGREAGYYRIATQAFNENTNHEIIVYCYFTIK